MSGHQRTSPLFHGVDMTGTPQMGARVRRNLARPSPTPSPNIDVWYQPPSQNGTPQQPTISFARSVSSSPMPPTLSPGLHYSAGKSTSPLASPHPDQQTGLGLSWRKPGDDLASRRRKQQQQKSPLTLHQIVMGAGALVGVTVLYFLLRSGQSSPSVRRMQREEHDATRARSSSLPLFQSTPRRDAASFRDELSSDARYLTSPQSGELASQVMDMYHLTHLASVLSRIPIIAPFSITSDTGGRSVVPVSALFDIPRFSQLTGLSTIDWSDIRPQTESHTEQLGCWIGETSEKELRNRGLAMQANGVEASFWPLKATTSRTQAGKTTGDQLMASHSFIASFDRDESAKAGLIDQAMHTSSVTTLTSNRHTGPEGHVFCIDHTLYRPEHPTTAHTTTHLDPRDHTAFNSHGRALHFTPELQETALDIVAYLLGHRSPFIAVHISAAARASECALRPEEPCTPTLAAYVAAVERVRRLAMLAGKKTREQRHSVRALSVVVSTDIVDLGFKGELAAAGWTLLDYEDLELRQRWGTWLPEIMDGVVQSKAAAFVGTRGSPQSTLAALRVHSWRSGPTELVFE